MCFPYEICLNQDSVDETDMLHVCLIGNESEYMHICIHTFKKVALGGIYLPSYHFDQHIVVLSFIFRSHLIFISTLMPNFLVIDRFEINNP